MPTVLIEGPFRFFFYSNENREPPHIHVTTEGKTAKYWLDKVELAHSNGFNSHELTLLRKIISSHRQRFLEKWHDYFKYSV